MQTNTNLRVVENNSHSSKDFTIQASGKMFHMVISGLYSNKPQSITREIWSNAFDAHSMVGKQDVPFEVTFPTALTPVFSCRDFGQGIAHADMEGFYTVLGHSTKENTNQAVGKWGVGRMSPMSYTDTFSVISRHKGLMAYYSVQLGPDGSPQLHVLAEPMPTDEADGLEVSFPVRRGDINDFQREAEVVSYGFKLPPTVKNSKDKQFAPINKILAGDGYYFYSDSKLNGTYAQMGCVLYPIDKGRLPHRTFDLNNNSIVYEFGIGELEVTASRESLSYGPNDPTLTNIIAKMGAVKQKMLAEAQANIDNQTSAFKAATLSREYRTNVGDNVYTYKGLEIPRHAFNLAGYDLNLYAGSKGYNNKTVGYGIEQDVYLSHDYTIFVQDLGDKKENVRAATRIASQVKSWGRYIWVKLDLSKEKAKLDKLVADLGFPVLYVKDLPDDGPKKSVTTRAKVSVSRLSGDDQHKYDMDDAEFKAGGYYVPMVNNNYRYHLHGLIPLVQEAFKQEIICVPKPLWKKFEGAGNWEPLEPALDAFIKLHASKAQDVLGNHYGNLAYNKLKSFDCVSGILGDFVKKISQYQAATYYGLGEYPWRGHLYRLGLPNINHDKVEAEYKAILDKYPLLKLYSGENTNDFLHYVNLVNNA